MMLQFTPFEPVVWLIFAVFVVCTLAIVKLFHLRYPNYPKDTQKAAKPTFAAPAVAEKKPDQPAGSFPGQYGAQANSRDGMDAKP
jgi:hypothetical protein